jgi:hypothetical protein
MKLQLEHFPVFTLQKSVAILLCVFLIVNTMVYL